MFTRRNWGRALRRGFTLVELMIVVSIIGVLAAIALIAYNKYSRSAASGEARAMLQSIRGAEDNYKAEVLNYMSCPATNTAFGAATFYPRVLGSLNGQKMAWNNPGHADVACWTQLNVKASGPVLFSYSVVSGPPGAITATRPAAMPGGWPFTGASAQNPYFIAVAAGDYNSDGIFSWLYASSETSEVTVVSDTD